MMSDKDDQDWIDLLAGQSVPDADPKTAREARIFRAALLAHSEKPKEDTEIPYPAIWEKLLTRLEVEKQETARRPSHTTRQYYDPLWALAASLFIAVFIVWEWNDFIPMCNPPGFDELHYENSISRSEVPCVNDIVNSKTRAAANHLQKELKSFGVKTQLCKMAQGWRVRATLPAVKPPALEAWLTRDKHLTVLPQNHLLCINFLDKKTE